MNSKGWDEYFEGDFVDSDWVTKIRADLEAAEKDLVGRPTAWAYEQVCAARATWQARADQAEAERDEALRDVRQLWDAAKETEDKRDALKGELAEYKEHWDVLYAGVSNPAHFHAEGSELRTVMERINDRIRARREKEAGK
jgi:uncharacterized coiled-coil DUF342 family protein